MNIKWVNLISIWVMITGGFVMSTGVHYIWGSPGLSDFIFRYSLATVIGNMVWVVVINVANNMTEKVLSAGFYWPYVLFSQMFTIVGALSAVAFAWLVQRTEIGLVSDANGVYFLSIYGVLFTVWLFAVLSYFIYAKFEKVWL
jgi:hypothetical protein